jgi:hypothetical protein
VGANLYRFKAGGSQTLQRQRGRLGKHNPRPGRKWSRNVRIRLQRPSQVALIRFPTPTGVLTGVAREEARDD